MSAVYSVGTLAELKTINPLSVSTSVGTRALYDGEKRAVLETGFTPSWYTWRPSASWATGIPNEIEPVIIRPTTNTSEGAWVSDSLHKVFSTVKPSDTPPNLFKEVNKGIEWITTFTSGSTARYISDGTVWKMLFISPIIGTVNPPTGTPDEIGQYYIYYVDVVTSAVYFSVNTTDSTGWAAL
jgi:hypothetical protein